MIGTLIEMVRRAWRGPPKTHRDHLENLRRNYWRDQKKLEEMTADAVRRGVCRCCVLASYGGLCGEYYELIKKQERREVLLDAWRDR